MWLSTAILEMLSAEWELVHITKTSRSFDDQFRITSFILYPFDLKAS
jgi:hypothetical protein